MENKPISNKKFILILITIPLLLYAVYAYVNSESNSQYEIIVRSRFDKDGKQQDDDIYMLDTRSGRTWFLYDGWRPLTKHSSKY